MKTENNNLPTELQNVFFPRILTGVNGIEQLGDAIFQLKEDFMPGFYPAGTYVRPISTTSDEEAGKIPGFHWDDNYATVCRVGAQEAEGVGVLKENLQYVGNVPPLSPLQRLGHFTQTLVKSFLQI